MTILIALLLSLFMINEYEIIYDIFAIDDDNDIDDHSRYQSQSGIPCTDTNKHQLSIVENRIIKTSSPFCLIIPSIVGELDNKNGQKESHVNNRDSDSLKVLPTIKEDNNAIRNAGNNNNNNPNLSSLNVVKDEKKHDKDDEDEDEDLLKLKSFITESLSHKGNEPNIIKGSSENDNLILEQQQQQRIKNEASPEEGKEILNANSFFQLQSGTVCSDRDDQVTRDPFNGTITDRPTCFIDPDFGKILKNLEGGFESDLIYGQDGLDVINGKDGNDILDGGNGDDTILGGNGNDELVGSFGDDWLFGGNGEDKVIGSFGNDYLAGGYGDDELTGGAGTDVLKGSAGSDFFDCGDDVDFVLDFNVKEGDIITQTCENVQKVS